MTVHVYVAGPLTKGDVAANIREACRVADILRREGLAPFVPHISFYWHTLFPAQYEEWLAYDFRWILRCDALLRLQGESPGSDREVAFAKEHGIPVYTNLAGDNNVVADILLEDVRAGRLTSRLALRTADKTEVIWPTDTVTAEEMQIFREMRTKLNNWMAAGKRR